MFVDKLGWMKLNIELENQNYLHHHHHYHYYYYQNVAKMKRHSKHIEQADVQYNHFLLWFRTEYYVNLQHRIIGIFEKKLIFFSIFRVPV